MPRALSRWPAAVALVASILGLIFGGLSSVDYSKHLDRQIHDVHCSFIPGAAAGAGGENACKVAMYSPYAALFRDKYWGGVPISLFALGVFAFFAAFSAYLLLAGPKAPRRAPRFLALFGLGPLAVSILMGVISATKLGQFCKTCVGIYTSSTLLAIAGIAAVLLDKPTSGDADESGRRVPKTMIDEPYGAPPAAPTLRADGSWLLLPAWALALGIFAITPALLYVSALPSYESYIGSCGKLAKPEDTNKVLLHVTPPSATQPATLLVDPLCPTCKAFHKRLATEGVLDKLDITLVLFPLDNECNWMLDRALHPGACTVAKAVLCSDHRAFQVLEWAYENQEELMAGAKAGGATNVKAFISKRWPGMDACIDAKETKLKLDKTLRWVVENQLPVSTPQMFLGETRLCDEDTDMGLAYTVRQIAPALRVQ